MDDRAILIQIATKDRPTELALLLESLRHQTYKNINVVVLDDGSTTPIMNYYFITYMIDRLQIEGIGVKVIRNNEPSGVSSARQQLVDYAMRNRKEKWYCRLDDDVVLNEDYFEKLWQVIDKGYDLATGITSAFRGPDAKREVRFVEPIINEVILDDKGVLLKNGDDCGVMYLEDKILPCHHFRSCALYKKELHDMGVDYKNRLSKNGFREEEIFSFKAILAGFKLGCHTGANALHLMTPSGGERDTMDKCGYNQQVFDETVKRMFEDNGNFIEKYNQKLLIIIKKHSDLELLNSSNLIYNKKEVSL